jgi:YVTN family beta-propeller protein
MKIKASCHPTLFRHASTLAIASLALCAVSASAAPFAYVPTSAGVSVVDTAINTVTATIPTAARAARIAITPDGKFAYVSESLADGSGAAVEVIATATNTVVANIPLASAPAGIAVSPDGQSVYVCNFQGSSVSVIATGANSVVAQIQVGLHPASIVFSPDGTSAWVANSDSNTVSVIDTATNTVANTISNAGSVPEHLAVSPTGSLVFVSGTQGISAIDIATGAVVASVSMPGSPLGLAVSPDGAFLYRTYSNIGGSFLAVVETAGYTVVTTIGARIVGHPGDLRVSPDGAFLYVSYPTPATVSVISTADYALVSSFSVAGPPGPVAFAPSNVVIAPDLITLHPATVSGGTSAAGYVVLNGAAPAGGAAVSLSSDDGSVTVPATVTVPAGSKTATFNVATQPVGSSESVNISAVYSSLSKSAVFTVIPASAVSVSSVSVNPTTVIGNNAATGTVTLSAPAPSGGVTVDLWTNGSPAFVPASVTVPAGSTTATFPVTTIYTPSTVPDTITAFLNGTSATTILTVTPPAAVRSVSVNPTEVPGNGSATGTVTLNVPAPPGGTVLQLWTSGSLTSVPASVTVPAGSTTATFPVTTGSVAASTQSTISAFLDGRIVATSITVTPLAVASLSVFDPTLAGSSSTTGNVRLNLPVTAPTVIQLWTNGSPVFVPTSVTIPAGGKSATFTVTTNYVSATTQGAITAYLNGVSTTTPVTVTPIALASITAGPPIQTSGMSIGGRVTLAGPAPSGGVVVQLWTNGSPVFVHTTSVTVPFGSNYADFEVDTDFVASPTVGTITAFLNGQSMTATVTVTPPLALVSVSVSPASVPCGGTATGTVTLNSAALTSQPTVYLWTNGSPAFVTPQVDVQGSATATFPVWTNCVGTPTQGTITAFLNGQTVTTTINVTQ